MLKAIGQLLCAVGKALGGGTGSSADGVALMPNATIGINMASSILLDKLEEIGDDKAEIYLPDREVKIYRKEEVVGSLELREVSAIKYVAEAMDCDDFAALLYGKFAGLVWTNLHAMNFFIDDKQTFWFIEPQTGQLSRELEGWQGNDVRFFVAR